MNIFWLDQDRKLCAQYHIDRHIVKMPLETAQLLSTTYWECGSEGLYRPTHKNHPCAIWVRESLDNFKELCEHGLSLCEEYTYRYNKVHKCQSVIQWCRNNVEQLNLKLGRANPPQCMPEQFKCTNHIEAYRAYYRTKKTDNKGKPMDFWTKRQRPGWW